ncbi:MAG: hypothetical protein V7607_4704 [Solirubrobacteraceae bacterium]
MMRARFIRGGKHAAADGEQTGILEIEPGGLGVSEQEDSP